MGFQKSISYENPRHGAPGPIGTSMSNPIAGHLKNEKVMEILAIMFNRKTGRKEMTKMSCVGSGTHYIRICNVINRHLFVYIHIYMHICEPPHENVCLLHMHEQMR